MIVSLKICYISDSSIPSKYANSVHVMKMCQAFAMNGHEVILYARKAEGYNNPFKLYDVEPIFEIKTCKFPKLRKIGTFIYAYNVVKEIRKEKYPDILYSRHSYSLAASLTLGVPMVYETHAAPPNRITKKFLEWIIKRKNFCYLVVISNGLKNTYQSLYPWLSDEKVIVAHDGADIPDKGNEFNTPNNSNLNVGYTGHLYPGRGMEIITYLANELPHINFHIVGGMTDDIIYWKNKCNNDNLKFHGFVEHNKINSYLDMFDIVLAPYQKKVYTYKKTSEISKWISPMKIFEYMAAGKPIISSNLPTIREVLEHDVNALLVEPDDVLAWKNAILCLENDETRRFKLGKEAKKTIMSNYTWRARAKKVLNNLF